MHFLNEVLLNLRMEIWRRIILHSNRIFIWLRLYNFPVVTVLFLDPFRFGQRAAVFCPIYSERCNLPVPEKPVPPTQKPPVNPLGEALSNRSRVCAQYRGFAIAYCNNPFALQRPDVREGCSKYRRWCTRSGRRWSIKGLTLWLCI